ncbi:MAG TPA: hypothetical protein VKH46_05690 [Thermoanaerobaculia bacterium]|jgi:hypothetical protein|nr:hypothetical protein [Thermoanaerobaculia bacterium]
MNPKGLAAAGSGTPLRLAIADAYERASALTAYFGRLTGEAVRGEEAVPTASELAEVEAMIEALAAVVRELPRLAMGSRDRSPEKIDEAAQG